MPKVISGQLSKMTHKEGTPIQYFLNLGEDSFSLTSKVGQIVNIKYTGKITCVECGRKIKKTYSDGYCFPCARDLPENDICSVRPEKCQHDKGNEADLCVFDINKPWIVNKGILKSKSKNTPIEDRKLQGQVLKTFVNGEVAFERV